MLKRKQLFLRRPKSTKALNQVPGTVTYIGRKESVETKLEVIDYNKESFEALNIYYNNFQASEFLEKPYTIACINVITAESDSEAEKISTSLIRMMLGVLTGKIDYLQEPTEMTPDLKELSRNPAFERMLKYSFVGSKETVKHQTEEFLQKTGVNELMVASHIFDHETRLNSYRIFSEIMKEL